MTAAAVGQRKGQMARRSKEEMLTEFHRLYEVFEVFCDFKRSRMSPEAAAKNRSEIPTKEQVLSLVAGKRATLSQIIAGTREAINDQNSDLSEHMEVGDEFVSELFHYYRQRTGRDYFADVGHPKTMARTILRRGKIIDETEFRLISDTLSNVDQTVFKGDEVELANQMVFRFEDAVGKS